MNPPSPFDLAKNLFGEFFKSEAALDDPNKSAKRIECLARKMHTVGKISLPIPNIVALQLILKLGTENILDFTLESLYILFNQTEEDNLFLQGTARDIRMAKLFKQIHAHQVPQYYLCLREMLAEIEKKNLNSAQQMKQMAELLISRATSPDFPKPLDNPSDTSSLN